MRNPYDVLGVKKSATDDEIQRAYRALAKKHHPDLNPNDPKAEETFKEVSAAYHILGDSDRRARYDKGEIDESGAERPERQYYRGYSEAPSGGKYYSYGGAENPEDLESMFADLFGGMGGSGRPGAGRSGARVRGSDVSYTLRVDFLEAARGARRTVTMPDGRTLSIGIPAGVHDRQMLRLKGQGGPGFGGGAPGDAYVEIHIDPHAFFRRKDNDIHMELPVTLQEAVLGGKVDVPTVAGNVSLKVPKGSNTGTRLRLKGKGVVDAKTKQAGDQYVELKVVLPETIDDELKAFVETWAPKHGYDPRRAFKGEGAA